MVTAAVEPVQPVVTDLERKVDALEHRLLYGSQVHDLEPPVPLIDGVLWENSLVELYGKPGCGKSFLALDWAMCVATGKPWQQHEVQQGSVLYIVGEGVSGVGKRVKAWEQSWGRMAEDVHWLQNAVPLMEESWVSALQHLAGRTQTRYRLVVVDTLSRAIAGHNENAAETMSKVVSHLDWLRENLEGACVLLVHHSTKAGDTTRGHSALEGASDVRWKLTKDVGSLVLANEKSKDESEAAPLSLALRQIPLGVDRRGRALTSAVIESHSTSEWATDTTPAEDALMRTMRDSFGTTGASMAQLREVADLPKSTFYRGVNLLLSKGELVNLGTEKRMRLVLKEGQADG